MKKVDYSNPAGTGKGQELVEFALVLPILFLLLSAPSTWGACSTPPSRSPMRPARACALALHPMRSTPLAAPCAEARIRDRPGDR
jgi:hypothetical protein